MKRKLLIPCGLASFLSMALASFNVPWQTWDGGGGVSSAVVGAATWTVTGTIGQADAHASSSAASSFTISDGYWAAVVPAANGPTLTINKSGLNAIVSWGADAVGYQLQQSPDLLGWSAVGNVITAAGQISATPGPGTPKLFFRLKLP
jgi:hypothetical protein